jgi:hypothetical protein
MAKPKSEDNIRFVDDLPPKGRYSPWAERLTPLVRAPRRWAEVWTADTPYQAQDAVSNLNRRKVQIPHPDHDWQFASRGCLVFAMYGGPGRRSGRRVKRNAS